MPPIRAHASGCVCQAGNVAFTVPAAASTTSVLPDVQARQGDEVHGYRQDDAGDEEAAEQLAVEAQVHEVESDDRELGDHHEQHQGDDRPAGTGDVVDRHLRHRDGEEDQGDLDV